jgi:hypothetical protein
MNINIEGHEYLCFIPEPWRESGQIPIDWFKENIGRFLYSRKHILTNAVPYELNDGPNKGGVHFLIASERIMYVGISNAICKRLIQHKESRKTFTHY